MSEYVSAFVKTVVFDHLSNSVNKFENLTYTEILGIYNQEIAKELKKNFKQGK